MQNRGGDCIDSVLSFKTTQDDFDIEFDILAPASSGRLSKIEGKIQEIDDQLMLCQQSVDEINTDIDCLTNHADGLDYAIAALSGILTGLIDSFIVGEWKDWTPGKNHHGDYTMVFGHSPTMFFRYCVPLEVWFGEKRIGVDCGSGFPEDPKEHFGKHGRLACLRLDDMKVFYSD